VIPLNIKPGTAQYDGLVEALDQYCANQSEHEECAGDPPSEKLVAAQELLAELQRGLIDHLRLWGDPT
jgi:hypothetical protein